MFSFFGKKKIIKTPTQIIMELKDHLSSQEKRETYLENRIGSLREQAKIDVKNNNKKKAILLLKKAKMAEKQLETIYGIKENLETQIFTIEQGINNNLTIQSMKEGKTAIEQINSKLDIDQIGELMDNISDNILTNTEIGDSISRPIGEVYDDDELLAELETTNKIEEHVPKCTIYDLPNVPTTTIGIKTQKEIEEQELAELLSEM